MNISNQLTIGDIITAITLLVTGVSTGVGVVYRVGKKIESLDDRLDELGWKMDMVWKWFKKEHDLNGGHDQKK